MVLVDSNLIYANLDGVNLKDKDLTGANLSGVDLSGKDLTGTILTVSYTHLTLPTKRIV